MTRAYDLVVVIAILTVAVALARAGVVQRFRNLLPVMNRIAARLMLVAGAYVAYYGWYEIRVRNGATGDPIVDSVTRFQTWLQNTIVPDDRVSFAVVGVTVLSAVAAGAVVFGRLRHRERRPSGSDGVGHGTWQDQTT